LELWLPGKHLNPDSAYWHGLSSDGRKIMVRKLITIIALASGIAVAACNTVEGVGKDVESVGDTVSDAAH
jgi:predicted small secreted protein